MTIHSAPLGDYFASTYLPLPTVPLFREALEAQIERMIDMLDALDGDPDLEPDLAGQPNRGAPCDAEGDDTDLEPNGDEDEPSLGSLSHRVDQLGWASGDDSDAEGPDDEDDEDGGDAECSLGSPDRMMNQEHWAANTASGWWYANSDRELDRSDFEDGGDTEPNGDELDSNGDESDGDAVGNVYWRPVSHSLV